MSLTIAWKKRGSFLLFNLLSLKNRFRKRRMDLLKRNFLSFKVFFIQSRTLRKYPQPAGAHLLGYVGEVSPATVEKNPYYKQGDYIGITGLERYYEKELRGKKGMQIRMVDVLNREVGSYQNGRYDTAAIMGTPLYTSIDIDLQSYGELLMKNKRGSIIALEPATGEILAMISSPTYDPNLLVGRVRAKNFSELYKDPLKPLLPRAIQGRYAPGSTFKMGIDLIALQYGTLTPTTAYSCQGEGSFPISCTHSHITPLTVKDALTQSCNPFHWQVFSHFLNSPQFGGLKKAFQIWYDGMYSFGFGHKLGSDVSFELKGSIPTVDFYDRAYNKKWNAMTVRSLSIGQGEMLTTPLQLANYCALLANRGFYYPPHIVKATRFTR